MVSIIICCFNCDEYVAKSILSVLGQTHRDLELIFVNDGSTDNSAAIAISFEKNDSRVKVVSQQNRGLNSARNLGAKHISEESEALLFFDADDIMDKNMIASLYKELKESKNIGAVYCNFKFIDEDGNVQKKNLKHKRIIPVKKWFAELTDNERYTPFFPIYSWTTMGEAFTLIKKELFFKYGGWDEKNFPKGDTYGESIPLFGQIALNHKVVFVNEELYLYRKHSNQITSGKFDNKYIQNKIDKIMLEKQYENSETKKRVEKYIKINRYRLPLYNYINGSIKHELRYKPLKAFKNMVVNCVYYLYSLRY